MNACPALYGADAGIAQALQAVDCRTGEATAFAFGRLFGTDGRLLAALTLLLTLYVALFAVQLLTGRTRLGVSALTPRMLTIGLVLTFATSWAAYQNVVWTLTTGAPDQLASLLAGTHGSAVTVFGDRLDRLFTAVASAADAASKPAPPTETGITPATPMVGMFTASTVLWLSALMLLLGTLGVLVTAKVALAAMLATGPLFILLALFAGTRGLFEGWCKATVLFAVVPLFTVLIGGGAVVALEPIVRDVALHGAEPAPRAVAALFLGASVYCALMAMALKTAGVLVAGWRLPFAREPEERSTAPAAPAAAREPALVPAPGTLATGARGPVDERIRGLVAALPAPAEAGADGRSGTDGRARRLSAEIVPIGEPTRAVGLGDPRAHGLGRRFQQRPSAFPKEIAS